MIYSHWEQKVLNTYCSFPCAGPAMRTSETATEGSPSSKWGLSKPPLTAIPNPKVETWTGKTQVGKTTLNNSDTPCQNTYQNHILIK